MSLMVAKYEVQNLNGEALLKASETEQLAVPRKE